MTKEKVMKFIKKYYVAVIIILCSILLDQLTKLIASNNLEYRIGADEKVIFTNSVEIIKNFFYFTYARNTGAGWSILSGEMWILIIITIVSFAIFIYLLKDFDLKKFPFSSIGVALMLGGTLGNFIDRISQGFVVDFLDFIIFGYDFPIFNVADICLVVGAIMLIFQVLISKEFFFDKKEKETNEIEEEI